MQPLTYSHDAAVDALAAQLYAFVTAARSFGDLDLLGSSCCHGWSRLDLVTHVRSGLEEMARGTSRRTASLADTDAASYWRTYPGSGDAGNVDGILWLRRTASAYGRPTRAFDHLAEVAADATTAIRAMPACVVSFQGRRIKSGDFLATWVVELAVHQIDLAATSGPPPPGLAWTRQTLEALADAPLPVELDDLDAVLAGLGRAPHSHPLADSYPISL